ncbi:hypothetical protein [Marinimicrobium agarilyticum]|uniref:hypothetical protein n=1 Tax=Marinimicrobium agarilyticum TaxID=306546 RepID=UPI0004082270|nr:hypothetical protein [Marinimicrobium agarilyticum]
MLKKPLFLAALLFPPAAFSDDVKPPVFIDVKDKGKFDLLFDRAKSTATGAAVGGLIGAGVEAAVRSGNDEEKLEQLRPFLSVETCETELLSAFEEKLSGRGYTVENEAPSKSNALTVELEIKECGFKVVNSQTLAMAAFINFETRSDDTALLSLNDETFHFYGKERYQFAELVDMEGDINSAHKKVFQKAGVRLANKIIYR